MILKKLNGEQFSSLIINGAKNLRANYQEVDSLNVFPVPDGDTGTNMARTIEGGAEAIKGLKEKALEKLAKNFLKAHFFLLEEIPASFFHKSLEEFVKD